MPQIEFHSGKRPAQPARPHLKLSAALGAKLASPPPGIDWYSVIRTWPMYANDRYGCCVWSAIGHEIQQKTGYASGTPNLVTDDDLLAAYHAVTGFLPSDPGTDKGTYVQDALKYWRTSGIAGAHQPIMYAEVQVGDQTEVQQAIQLFGDVHVGFAYPMTATIQFNDGLPWTVVRGAYIEGGHAVTAVGYDDEWIYVVTWGALQRMSWEFWRTYVDESWVILTQEWISKQTLRTAGGLDLYTLGESFAELTNEANPIPTPEVPPGPIEVPDSDRALWNMVRPWAKKRHEGTPLLIATHLREWAAGWRMQ